MNSPKIRFLYFLEYWSIPFGVLQTCCKIQKRKKIIFFLLCLRNPCENTFSKFQIFIFMYIKKKHSKHIMVLAVYNTQEKKFKFNQFDLIMGQIKF